MAESKGKAAGPEEKDGDAPPAPPKKKKLSGKVLVLYIILPSLLALSGIGAGLAWFLGIFGGGAHVEKVEPAKPKVAVFHDLPEMLVNLNGGTRQAVYLKIRVSLEFDDPEAIKKVDMLLPRVIDNFQTYLRELKPDELTGSAGLFRLKEELLLRVNIAIQPLHINNVLFKEMLLQ